jgi:hypothetical protein
VCGFVGLSSLFFARLDMAGESRKPWFLFSIYMIGGLCLGVADQRLGAIAQAYGLRSGIATAAVVNLVLPLLAIGLAAANPSYPGVVLGAFAMTLAYLLGLAVAHPAHGWNVMSLLRSIKPVIVLACVGYAVLGVITVGVMRHARPPQPGGPLSRVNP